MLSKRHPAGEASRRVLLAVAIAVVAGLVVGLLALSSRDGGSVSVTIDCSDSVVWGGVTYTSDQQLRVTRRRALGTGEIPCRGGDPEQGGADPKRVRVQRFGEVPPAVAIAVEGSQFAYFAEGFLVPLRSHPLHRRVYGSDAKPQPPNRKCRGGYEWDAEVVNVLPPRGDAIVVRRRNARDAYLKVHAATRVRGFSKDGHPYLRPGDLVRVRGVTCPGSNLVLNEVRRRN